MDIMIVADTETVEREWGYQCGDEIWKQKIRMRTKFTHWIPIWGDIDRRLTLPIAIWMPEHTYSDEEE